MRDPDIAEVADTSGLPASAIRYYEKRGLIRSSGRRGIRRTFSPEVVEQLALIEAGREAGFSVDEIAQMFGTFGGFGTIERETLASKEQALGAKIRRLETLRRFLRHAVSCPAPTHSNCAAFREVMKPASRSVKP